jgi:hypothetical protein
LGLPEGSIRALIALGLILLFFILAVFLYADLLHGTPGNPGPHGSAGVDIAKQLATTISTLVVAIASFYFGSSAVSQAAAVVRKRDLTVVEPVAFPVALSKTGETWPSQTIRFRTDPAGEPVTGAIVEGDPSGSVTYQSGDRFEYAPGAPTGAVRIRLSLANAPEVSRDVLFQA